MADHTEGVETDPEPILGFFNSLLGWVDSYTKIKKYWRTRSAVLRGEKIFDLTSDDLKARDLMGPLTFNVYQSTLSGLRAAALAVLLGVFLQSRITPPKLKPGTSEFAVAAAAKSAEITRKIQTTVRPFVAPFVLLLGAWSTAWGSLKKSDSSGPKRRRCRNAFLYYDGAYGLWVQAVLSLGIALAIARLLYVIVSPIPLVVGGVLFLAGGVYQFYLSFNKIPVLLFLDNGYSIAIPGDHVEQVNEPTPWGRYLRAVILTSILILIALVLIFAIEVVAGSMTALFVVWLKLKITGKV